MIHKVKDIVIAYIGGGSRGWARGLMADLAMDPDISGTVRLYDTEKQAALDNVAIGNGLEGRPESVGSWRYSAHDSLKETLSGADFIFISILPGTFAEMASDVHEPEKYGIWQSVGDTVGPGGLVRALRTIPYFIEFACAVEQFCPKAWVINYTNPMSLCVRTLYEVFPAIKAFGCCHEVFGTQSLLVHMLRDMKGIEGVHRRDIKVNVLGINHFTWFDEASWGDMDLMPLYRQFAVKYRETGFDDADHGHWMNSTFASANRVKFDLFLRYGLIAAAGDRHLAEFMPPWYLKDPETVEAWMFGLTKVDWRVKDQEAKRERTKKLLSGQEKLELKSSGEEGIMQVKALLGLGDMITNTNVPNQGQMDGVPRGAVVETNTYIGRDSVKPVFAGSLPPDVHTMVIRHISNQENILCAAIDKNRDLAFNAFLNDPLVTISRDKAEQLFDTMLRNTEAYLPGWKL